MGSLTYPYMGDLFAGYLIKKGDSDASPNYYGFVRADGAWYILRETLSAGDDSYAYAKGSGDFDTNWTGRVGLTYVSYENLTLP